MSINRRVFLKSSVAAAAAAAVPKQVVAHGRTNVLFIAVDDLNHSLGCYGEPVHTPNLDALAARGTRFDAAYCQYPLCGPSRTSLLTGLAPDATGVLDNDSNFRKDLPDVVTLPELFRKNGYYTARVGKIFHANNPLDEGRPGADDPRSWDYTFNNAGVDRTEQLNMLVSYTKKPAEVPPRHPGGLIGGYESPSSDRQITDGVGADEIIRLLKEKKDAPFFIGYGLYRPHLPWVVPKEYFEKYPIATIHAEPLAAGEMKVAPAPAYNSQVANRGMDDEHCRMSKAAYYASITYIDGQIGRVLQTLKELGLESNTVVVFLADHGFLLGQHGMWEKMTVFEWTARVPFIAAGPGVDAGAVVSRTTEHLDVYPTLVELCGLQKGPTVQGLSLAPLLKDASARGWNKAAVTQVRRGGDTVTDGYSLRTEQYRYTRWLGATEGEELYDYKSDPHELNNEASNPQFETLKAELRQKLDAIRKTRSGRRV